MPDYQESFQPGPTVLLTGPPTWRKALAVRLFNDLAGMGVRVELLAEELVRQLFWPELGGSGADLMASLDRLGNLCLLLNQQGILVLADAEEVPRDMIEAWQERLPYLFEAAQADSPEPGPGNADDSARRILNRLLEAGLVEVAGHRNMSPEDHAAIEKRLRDLGYL